MKEKLKVGTMLSELYSPNAARIVASAGADFMIIDCEHGPYGYGEIAAMIACAKAMDFTAIVRVPLISREPILKYLDMGAAGILVPMIRTDEDVKRVVEFARYKPLGNRGISTTRSHNHYDSSNIKSYMERANESVKILIQIETKESVENLERIACVKGISGLMIGPNDLSSDFGDFGNYETEQMREAIRATAQIARKNGLLSGMISSSQKLLRMAIQEEMEWISWGSELSMIRSSLKKQIENLKGGAA